MKVWRCRTCGHYFCSENPDKILAEHMLTAHHEISFIPEADFTLQVLDRGAFYINFSFSEIIWTEMSYEGKFEASDNDVSCRFHYSRKTRDIELWDVEAPDDRVLPLPIFWLDRRLKETGNLDGIVARVCF